MDYASLENNMSAAIAKIIPNVCLKVIPCFRKTMHKINVINGYIEVISTTGMAGPFRRATIKKMHAMPLANPFNKPYILPLAESSGLKSNKAKANTPEINTPRLE